MEDLLQLLLMLKIRSNIFQESLTLVTHSSTTVFSLSASWQLTGKLRTHGVLRGHKVDSLDYEFGNTCGLCNQEGA